jgi:hypothetical protein
MQELNPNEVKAVSAGPTAVTPLALLGQCNSSTSIPTLADAGVFASNDSFAIAK